MKNTIDLSKINFREKVSQAEFSAIIVALARDIVLSARFADPNLEGHISKGDVMQCAADLENDLENRCVMRMANPNLKIPPEEKKIFEDGEDYLAVACEANGLVNPIEEYR